MINPRWALHVALDVTGEHRRERGDIQVYTPMKLRKMDFRVFYRCRSNT